jgi:hypothetical protein
MAACSRHRAYSMTVRMHASLCMQQDTDALAAADALTITEVASAHARLLLCMSHCAKPVF